MFRASAKPAHQPPCSKQTRLDTGDRHRTPAPPRATTNLQAERRRPAWPPAARQLPQPGSESLGPESPSRTPCLPRRDAAPRPAAFQGVSMPRGQLQTPPPQAPMPAVHTLLEARMDRSVVRPAHAPPRQNGRPYPRRHAPAVHRQDAVHRCRPCEWRDHQARPCPTRRACPQRSQRPLRRWTAAGLLQTPPPGAPATRMRAAPQTRRRTPAARPGRPPPAVDERTTSSTARRRTRRPTGRASRAGSWLHAPCRKPQAKDGLETATTASRRREECREIRQTPPERFQRDATPEPRTDTAHT